MNELELTGRARTHIVELEQPRCALHYAASTSFLAMRDAAAAAGIDLVAASSFRDFDRQLRSGMPSGAASGPLLDRAGRPLDAASLDEAERIDAILCWSALPGGSRHHWGTDVRRHRRRGAAGGLPRAARPGGVRAGRGVRAAHAVAGREHGRASASTGRTPPAHGGAGVEPWHLSYWPVAAEALEALTLPVLRRAVAGSEILGRESVLERLPEIYTRFILAVDFPRRAEGPGARRASSPRSADHAQGSHGRVDRRDRASAQRARVRGHRLRGAQRSARRRAGRDSVRRVLAGAVGAPARRRAARARPDRRGPAARRRRPSPGCARAAASTSSRNSRSAGIARACRPRRSRRLDDADHREPLQGTARLRQRRLRLRPGRCDAARRPRVRLLAPPPLDTPLELAPAGEGDWLLGAARGTGRARHGREARPRGARPAALRAGRVGLAALRGLPRARVPGMLRLRAASPTRRRAADLPRHARQRHRRRALAAGGLPRRRRRQGRAWSSTGPRSTARATSRSRAAAA